MRITLTLAIVLTIAAGCTSDRSPEPGAVQQDTLSSEEIRVVQEIARLDSMRIARAETISAEEDVNRETFARVCMPVGQRVQQLNAETDWVVRQLATKYRNPANAADDEAAAFIARLEADPDLEERWTDAVFEGESGRRYLRRINVEETCLTCHGDFETRPAFVAENYPDDRAHGFEAGDVRGVYSVFVPAGARQ